MATFADIFSGQNIDKLMADPRLQLGLQLLAAGGYQPNDVSTGQRFAQAGMGFMQQRADMQQQQQLAAYRQMQMEQAQARQADTVRQAEIQKRMQDPTFLQQLGPLARAMASYGADPSQIISAYGQDNMQAHRQAQLDIQQQRFDAAQARGQGGAPGQPKAPTPRQIIDEPLQNGMVQRHKYNPQTGGYDPFGAPFSRSSSGKASPGTLEEILNSVPTDNQDVPDINAGAGPAVPGLPGSAPLASYIPSQAAAPAQPTVQQAPPMAAQGSVKPKQPAPIAAEANAPATPQTQAEYDALPEGTVYVDPATGGVFTKKAKKARG